MGKVSALLEKNKITLQRIEYLKVKGVLSAEDEKLLSDYNKAIEDDRKESETIINNNLAEIKAIAENSGETRKSALEEFKRYCEGVMKIEQTE